MRGLGNWSFGGLEGDTEDAVEECAIQNGLLLLKGNIGASVH